jgi:antitoxin (DNA-binding transcriptional repressor) of toxin-antitoxin stability system
MNCQDIARILDEQEVDGLLTDERSAAQVHLASCAECARDWQIHAQLSGARIPEVPAELRALYQREVGIGAPGTRRSGRLVVIGALVAVAAAAAMLGVQLRVSRTEVAPVAVLPQRESVVATVAGEAFPAVPDGRAGEIEQSTEQAAPSAAASADRLRIVMMPTRYDSGDKTARSAIDAFQSSLLMALRNTPDVMVEVAGRAAAADDLPANRITVVSPRVTVLSSGDRVYHSGGGEYTWTESGTFHNPQQRWMVEVMLEPAITKIPSSNSGVHHRIDGSGTPSGSSCGAHGIPILNIGNAFPGGRSAQEMRHVCSSVEKLAARLIAALRPQVEPPASDTALFITRLADASSPVRDREAAFSELLRRARSGAIVLDSAAGEAIAAYIGSLPPDQRRQRLLSFRGVRQSGLVQVLLAFLQQDDNDKVRLEALSVLVKDYVSQSNVRTALEAATRQDASQLVRMVAQRTLHGDAQWEPYVVATLLDRSQPIRDRLAPAQYEAGLANYPEGFEKMQSYLGSEEVTRQLLDIFQELRSQTRQPARNGIPAMQGVSPTSQGFQGGQQPQDEEMQRVVSLLSMTNPSAAIDLQIRILTEDPQSYSRPLSSYALSNLLDRRRRDDSRVIKALEDVAAGKSGPELRNQLERALATR